jgi:phage shock protein PspC (stress-responsive transcriptional regulator)
MDTVIVVNLNGIAYHIEQPGYQALRAYLDAAQSQLKDNPDRAEILADLEQAIADKCGHYLTPHKNVVSSSEIGSVLKEMGPVQSDREGGNGSASDAQASARTQASGGAAPTARRLYQIREGAMLSGVCTGIAAFLNIDVTIVRVLFVVLVLLTGGLWIVAYIIMMFVIPFANTDEEHAAAAGSPFNAKEVVDRARKNYAQFKDDREWRRHWRQQRREWRRRWRDGAYWWGHNLQRNVHQFSSHTGYFGQVFAGLMIPLLALVGMALFVFFITGLVSLTSTGVLFGWTVAQSIPLWAAALILCLVYGAVASPLHNMRRAFYLNRTGYPSPFFAAWDSVFSLAALLLVGWLAYTHIPPVHALFQNFPDNIVSMWHKLLDSFHHAGADLPHTAPTELVRLADVT